MGDRLSEELLTFIMGKEWRVRGWQISGFMVPLLGPGPAVGTSHSLRLPPWPFEFNELFGILNIIMEEVIGFFICSAFCIHLFHTYLLTLCVRHYPTKKCGFCK